MMKIYVDQIKSEKGTAPAKFNSENVLGEHSEQKDKDDDTNVVYCCSQCKFETKEERQLTVHIKKKHESFKCEECKIIMDSKNKLNMHIEKDHARIECDICNFNTRSKKDMDVHVDNIHNKMFSCEVCDYESPSKRGLQTHMKEHSAEVDFKCKVCNYTTILEQNYIDHAENKHKNGKKKPSKIGTPCIYWNKGSCANGDRCRFSHVEIPECYYQDRCRKSRCPWYHYDKSLNNFLGRSSKRGMNRQH